MILAATPRRISIAGTCFELRTSRSLAGWLRLPESFTPFETPDRGPEIELSFRARGRLGRARGDLLCESHLNWRLLRGAPGFLIEMYLPSSGRVYCRAEMDEGFRRHRVHFDRGCLDGISAASAERHADLVVPHPLDQLLVVPALARRDAFLLHACGVVAAGKAYVFAGHSGDGKTTLARMLAAESFELLSDERVAIRRKGGRFRAYGTPWPGEGDVVSPASYPLGGIYVLRKASRHAFRGGGATTRAEILARAVIPYYFPGEAARTLGLFDDLAGTVPLGELEFALAPGLGALLPPSEAA